MKFDIENNFSHGLEIALKRTALVKLAFSKPSLLHRNYTLKGEYYNVI